ncbi:MAG: hypothetical protein OEX77_10520 [Candidatus Bathyarchaeota archaeon]|nr:hypothetical protein [Candidatus Bathyarchaeota archaeon]
MTGRPQNNFSEAKVVKKERKRIKFCPKCGSTNIQWASGLPQLWSIWECRDCGYRGAFIVEDSTLAEKIREKFLKAVKEE